MKTKLNLVVARMFCAVALGIGLSVSPAAAAGDSPDIASAKTSVPWSQLGAKAGADYQGDGLAVTPTAEGARLRCVFQQLEGEATREGLWLTSTVTNAVNDPFRLVATEVGRVTPCAPSEYLTANCGAHGVTRPTLASTSIAVVMINKGEPKENRAKVKEHGLTFPVVLQQQWEISRPYAMLAEAVPLWLEAASAKEIRRRQKLGGSVQPLELSHA